MAFSKHAPPSVAGCGWWQFGVRYGMKCYLRFYVSLIRRGGDVVSWFEIQKDTLTSLTYRPPMVPFQNEDNFSSLTLWIVLGIAVAVIFFVKLAYHVVHSLEGKVSSFWRVIIVLGAIGFVYIGYVFMLLWNTPQSQVFKAIREGTFGDSFGTLNALFSGLAFAGVLLTMLFQRKDLSETRNQITSQQVESQFYSMLELQQEVVRNFDLQSGDDQAVVTAGRDCFRIWKSGIQHYYSKFAEPSTSQYPYAFEHDDKIIRAYEKVFHYHKADLGLYFRSLYAVFRFIDNCNHKDKGQFALVVRSLLSDNELILLFYNCLAPKGAKFKKYVYRYALFDNLEVGLLIRAEDINLFSFEAYGSNREILDMLVKSPSERKLTSPTKRLR
ncbi:putative phage abortive infection protein [Pseudomonas mosselii]|uniref:putative phage abortive infection protein n=1 Tax=Pseudomonas mosselii TaxID=78327 RepID=UPI002B060A59|nr:putative phage abortive infection protein [Pseudomonas mosselii]MEA3233206.1 putative phage abortive infection protein [Pseudomonas mosselii]